MVHFLSRSVCSILDAGNLSRLSFDELHGQEVDTLDLFHGKNGNVVGVVEGGHSAGLALESRQTIGINGHVGGQDFQRHVAGNVVGFAASPLIPVI